MFPAGCAPHTRADLKGSGMSTAVQPPATPPVRAAATHAGLVITSLFGALVVLGGLIIAGYVVPMIWQDYIAPITTQLPGFLNVSLRLLFQLAAAGGVIYAGTRLAGDNPPKGLRGGIFLVISTIITIFFVVRAVHINLGDLAYQVPVTLVVLGVLVFGAYRLLMSAWAETKMHAAEDQGWFHTYGFKATQGLKVRRYTLVGVLIVGWTGAWSLYYHKVLGYGDQTITIPFYDTPIAILSAKEFTIPFLIAAITAWFAWRLINVPPFADFLIATEAEMNKVSWSTRKRLFQDTIVVLVTVVILTTFLLVVDLFWGWLLSRSFIGVLPSKAADVQSQSSGESLKW